MLKMIAIALLSAWSMMTFVSTDSRTEQLDAISAKLAIAEAGGNPYEVSQHAKGIETDCSVERQHRRATAHHADKKREIAEIEDDTQAIQRDQGDTVNDAD